MPSVTLPVALAASAGAGLVGSAISGNAAQTAAKDQTQAEQSAQQIMQQQYQQTRADLLPYNTAGQGAVSAIQQTPAFNFNDTQAQLEATPGYQFNLSQGLKATQNSAAARGLGVSGAAQKGAASYASGLADTTYQNQFSNALNTYQTNLAKQQNLAGLGESAAAQTGAFGTQTAANIGQTAVGVGNAQAAGAVGTANAAASGLSGVGNAFLTSAFLNNPSNNAGIFGSASSGYGANGQLAPYLYGG